MFFLFDGKSISIQVAKDKRVRAPYYQNVILKKLNKYYHNVVLCQDLSMFVYFISCPITRIGAYEAFCEVGECSLATIFSYPMSLFLFPKRENISCFKECIHWRDIIFILTNLVKCF